jgi:hypothetical protein
MATTATAISQKKNGTPMISNERIEPDLLAKTIVSMINAMSADYGRVFSKQFPDVDTLTNYKRRLYQKLKGLDLDAIVDGYELCIKRNTKFCPTVPEIVESVLEVIKRNKKRDENQIEAIRVSTLPAPTIECDPLVMLSDAKKNISAQLTQTSKERMEKRREVLKNHEALLNCNRSKIKRHVASYEHSCEVDGCNKAGGISSGITGHGNYYCAEHYRMA